MVMGVVPALLLSFYFLSYFQDDRKGVLSLMGGSFGGFGGSGEHLVLLKIQCPEATVTVLTVSAVVAVLVAVTPLKLNPLFRHPDVCFTKTPGHLVALRGISGFKGKGSRTMSGVYRVCDILRFGAFHVLGVCQATKNVPLVNHDFARMTPAISLMAVIVL